MPVTLTANSTINIVRRFKNDTNIRSLHGRKVDISATISTNVINPGYDPTFEEAVREVFTRHCVEYMNDTLLLNFEDPILHDLIDHPYHQGRPRAYVEKMIEMSDQTFELNGMLSTRQLAITPIKGNMDVVIFNDDPTNLVCANALLNTLASDLSAIGFTVEEAELSFVPDVSESAPDNLTESKAVITQKPHQP